MSEFVIINGYAPQMVTTQKSPEDTKDLYKVLDKTMKSLKGKGVVAVGYITKANAKVLVI